MSIQLEVNGYTQLCLVTNILQNIYFCVQQKKKNVIPGLEKPEVE